MRGSLTRFTQFSKRYRRALVACTIALGVALGVSLVRNAGLFQFFELRSLDILYQFRPPEPPDDRLVILEISESDIQRLGKWPWSDRIFAQLIDRSAAAGAAVIGVDKYLDLPVGEGRQELVAAIARAGNVVNATFEAWNGSTPRIAIAADLEAQSDYGFVNLPSDPGNVIRRAVLAGDYDSFALAIAAQYLEKRARKHVVFVPEEAALYVGARRIPRLDANFGGYRNMDAQGYQVAIAYRGKEGTFARVSSVDLLAGKVDPQRLRDRIVLIGATAESVKDYFPTPFSTGERLMYGVEIHANIISQLLGAALDGRPFLQAWPESLEALWIVGWTLLGGALAALAPEERFNLLGVGVAGAVLAGSSYGAFLLFWWVPVFPAIVGLGMANMLTTAYQYALEREDRKQLELMFSRHLSPELVNVLWERREEFIKSGRIPGQEVYVTVLFTDMRNFSTWAEKQEPQDTLHWLNDYLGSIADAVLQNGGMVDKYIGDAVMAVFGVPVPSTTEEGRCRDAQNAVKAALDIATSLQALRDRWHAMGLPRVETGIGINSGVAIAGSLGSKERLEYSVLGDTVNVASRLESLNKEVDGGPHHILIGEDTNARLDGRFVVELADRRAVKGRKQETSIYRVLGWAAEANGTPT